MKNKKSLAAIIISLMCVALLCSIGIGYAIKAKQPGKEDSKESSVTKKEAESTKKTAEESTEKPSQAPKNIYAFEAGKVSDFDIEFLKLENENKNKVYSPLSIKYALKMLSDGTNGDSKSQIDAVIGNCSLIKYVSSQNRSFANALFVRDTFNDKISANYKKSLQDKLGADVISDSFATADNVNSYVSEKTLGLIPNMLPSVSGDTDLFLINALGIDMEWENTFLTGTIEYYHTGKRNIFSHRASYDYINYTFYANNEYIQSLKFKDIDEDVACMIVGASIDNYDPVKELGEAAIRETIDREYRKWLEEKKDDPNYSSRVKEIYDSGKLDENVENQIQNYLDGLTSEHEKNALIHTTDFMLYTDAEVKVFAKDLKEYDGTTLQYVGIMPVEKDLDSFIKTIDAKTLDKYISGLKELKNENFKAGAITKIIGCIPKFKFDYELNLTEDLKKLGIKDVFDENKADLSGITEVNGSYISSAMHKANIEFTQDGIKASAATTVGGSGGGGDWFNYRFDVPVEKIDLTFDKPYMFLIRDKKTGEVWFTGTVYNPSLFSTDPEKDPTQYRDAYH